MIVPLEEISISVALDLMVHNVRVQAHACVSARLNVHVRLCTAGVRVHFSDFDGYMPYTFWVTCPGPPCINFTIDGNFAIDSNFHGNLEFD